MANKNLIQMSIAGALYDIRDQRLAIKLDTINTVLNLAMDHKQDTKTAVVTDETAENFIGILTSGYASRVLRDTDDFLKSFNNNTDVDLYHTLWFSQGQAVLPDKPSFEETQAEELRAWSAALTVNFQTGGRTPIICGIDKNASDPIKEVDISGNALRSDFLNSPLGILYLKGKGSKDDIEGAVSSYGKTTDKWTYYGNRTIAKNKGYGNYDAVADSTNTLGGPIDNIALDHFFQREKDEAYYRVLSESKVANKKIKGIGSREETASSPNAYKIVTLDKWGIIPDNFLGEMKLDNKLQVGKVIMNVNTSNVYTLVAEDGNKTALEIEPENGKTTTKLEQEKISTNHITAIDAILSPDLKESNANSIKLKDGSITAKQDIIANGKMTIGTGDNDISKKLKTNTSITPTTIRTSNVLATDCLTIPIFTKEADAKAAAAAMPPGTAAIWIAQY